MRKTARNAPASGASRRPAGTQPVFVDATGRRLRWLVLVGLVLAGVCLAYLVAVVVSLAADPITPSEPSRDPQQSRLFATTPVAAGLR